MPKYIQIVAPVSAGLILDGSITTAKLASTLDLSGKTITYRSIVNADIAAGAAIALTKLASTPLSSIQRVTGSVTGTTEFDVVSLTPTSLPCKIIIIWKRINLVATTLKVTDGNNVQLNTVSILLEDEVGPANSTLVLNTGTVTTSATATVLGIIVGIIASGTTTPIKLRASAAATTQVDADMEVVS